jgi:long-chain acyl-CoA synthetase
MSDTANLVIEALRSHAQTRPDDTALIEGPRALSYVQLLDEVEKHAAQLQFFCIRTLALYADNGIGWIVADLAALMAGVRCVPLPRFFSDSQLKHALDDSGADTLLTDDDRLASLPYWKHEQQAVCGRSWRLSRRHPPLAVRLPEGTQKVTYTSGTTGEPKGVCLSAASQCAVAA